LLLLQIARSDVSVIYEHRPHRDPTGRRRRSGLAGFGSQLSAYLCSALLPLLQERLSKEPNNEVDQRGKDYPNP